MSGHATRALVERLKTDEEFLTRVMAEERPDARFVLIRAEGYDCTAEEIAALAVRLPDDALERVTAGLALGDLVPENGGSSCSAHTGTHLL